MPKPRNDRFIGKTAFLNNNPALPKQKVTGCYIETETILFPDSANNGAPERWYRHAIRYNNKDWVKNDSPIGRFEKDRGVRIGKFLVNPDFAGKFFFLKKYGDQQSTWQVSQSISNFEIIGLKPQTGFYDHQIFGKSIDLRKTATFEIEAILNPKEAIPVPGLILWSVIPDEAATLMPHAKGAWFTQKPNFVSKEYDDIEVQAVEGPCLVPNPTTTTTSGSSSSQGSVVVGE